MDTQKRSRYEVAIDPYWELLKISRPWELWTVQLDPVTRRLEFEFGVGCSALSVLTCSECGRECAFHDLMPERKWRPLNKTQFLMIIRAAVPRCCCPEHGVKEVRTPWSEPGARYVEHDDATRRSPLLQVSLSFRRMLLRKGFQRLYVAGTRVLRPIADMILRPLIARSLQGVEPASSAITLPFNHDPPYKTWDCIGADPLGILGACGDLKPLLASDYINFSCSKTWGSAAIVPWRSIGRFVSLGYCELLRVTEPLVFRTKGSRGLIEWMVDRIHDGWYIFTHVNKYYIPGHFAYLERDLPHDCLIVGCDTKSQEFDVAMHLATGTYGVTKVTFAHMAMALTLRGSRCFNGGSICYAPVVLAVRPKAAIRIQFDRRAACKNLEAYLHSTPPDEGIYVRDDLVYAGDYYMAMGYPSHSVCYGLEACRTVASHIRGRIKRSVKVEMTTTRALWEHKKIMKENIIFWGTRVCIPNVDKLSQAYEEVVQWAHGVHLLCLAYNLGGQRNSRELTLHLDRIDDMMEIDSEVLTHCYRNLELVRAASTDSFLASES